VTVRMRKPMRKYKLKYFYWQKNKIVQKEIEKEQSLKEIEEDIKKLKKPKQ